MKNIFYILIAAFSLILHAKCVGQNNIVYGAGISYTNGVPTFVPPSKSARVAIDTVTSKWYEYATPGGWRWSGDRVQDISGCSSPAYTPGKGQSSLVLNNCTFAQNGHGPELYKYTVSAWLCLNCGGNYTAGDGIDITGTEITNTAPDQVVSITGAGINAVTGTYPNFTVTGTEVDGSITNELQTLSVAGNNLTISDGNTVTLPTPSSTLDALTDVTITSPANNQILQYNSAGSQWVNATLSAITGSGASGQVSYWNGTASQAGNNNLFWDSANNRLGIGTNSPSTALTINGDIKFIPNGTNARNISWSNGYGSPALTLYDGGVNDRYGWGIAELQMQFFIPNGANYGWYSGGNFATSTANELMRLTGSGRLGIGTILPNSVAKLDVASTTQGVLFPRMTTTQRDAIASPPDGLVVYNTTSSKLQVRAASAWVDLH